MKDIKGYEGLYAATEDGKIWSYSRKKFLSPIKIKATGYYKVNLSKDGKQTTKYIHRLVAETFIPNEKQLPQVDHINRNKEDNRVENLRWVSVSDNLRNTKTNRKVKNNDTGEIFNSIAEAAETVQSKNFVSARSNIGKCCQGKIPSAYGMRWQYADQECMFKKD